MLPFPLENNLPGISAVSSPQRGTIYPFGDSIASLFNQVRGLGQGHDCAELFEHFDLGRVLVQSAARELPLSETPMILDSVLRPT